MGFFDFLFSSKPKKIKYKLIESNEHAESIIPLNKAILVEAGKTEICLSRTATGLYAMENKCPHEFKPLHKGSCTDEDELICPYHRHKIDLRTGQNKSHAGCGKADVFEIEQNEKGIYVIC